MISNPNKVFQNGNNKSEDFLFRVPFYQKLYFLIMIFFSFWALAWSFLKEFFWSVFLYQKCFIRYINILIWKNFIVWQKFKSLLLSVADFPCCEIWQGRIRLCGEYDSSRLTWPCSLADPLVYPYTYAIFLSTLSSIQLYILSSYLNNYLDIYLSIF